MTAYILINGHSNICYEFMQKGLMYMSKTQPQYTIIREYKNHFGIDELLKRILRFHIQNDTIVETNKECSNHEVTDDDRKDNGI